MPVPPRYEELARQLGDVYRQAEAEINAQLRVALREPSAGNARRRLRARDPRPLDQVKAEAEKQKAALQAQNDEVIAKVDEVINIVKDEAKKK